jgi:sugar phosphate isomerase/epimerase
MKLACNSYMVRGNSFSEKLDNLERWGFDGIELRVPVEEATPQYLDEIEFSLANNKIKACSFLMPGPTVRMKFTSREIMNIKVEAACLAIENGLRFGAVPFIPIEYSPQDPIPLWYRRKALEGLERDLFYEFLGKVDAYARQLSTIALIEPMNRYESHLFNCIEDVQMVIDQLGSNQIKIVADFFHMNIEEVSIADSLEKYAGYIKHIQLGDSNRELPGQGHIDFSNAFAILYRNSYDGFMALECRIPDNPDRDFPRTISYLKRCLENSKA